MSAGLVVSRAGADEAAIIANLMQFYLHDFSELWFDRAVEGELGPDGRYSGYPGLETYWRDPVREAWLFRIGGLPVGFALVNDFAHSPTPIDRAVAEFFVVRKHRRRGVGLAAAHALFGSAWGVWEAATVRRNTAARAFWRRVAETYPGVRDVVEEDRQDARWDGEVLTFRVG
ncbi:GNAT family N-acetyltransferase [Caulobacter vibrioides]|uniref:GNAT family N-acetyltransferase n=1 Tax=Caulobacter vibrioides TaxID=155892 RepID=UPI000BB4DDA3|nr:GNAT family N-acetyltransferase [Caulobacter vibrioides]ATC23138.1 GNAT family N-acetyltransferase [Caulobacter vibrioides]AZH11349.1 GNAT family N-acetyltransferase [Caulobacter vibrioides]PLR13189.1 GNAT family N-acetyltransferase [Caulobacter vibrioides]